MDTVDFAPTLKSIEDQKAAHAAEIAKLDQAAEALRGLVNGKTPSAPAKSQSDNGNSSRRPGRPPGRSSNKGTRADEALRLVAEHPGITIPDIAKHMKIQANYLYRVMPRLLTENRVRREGQGWHPVAAS